MGIFSVTPKTKNLSTGQHRHQNLKTNPTTFPKTMPRGKGIPKGRGRGRPRGLSFTTRRRSGIWKEPESTIVVTEHSEAVEAVKRKHAESKKMEAMDILQNNFDKTKRLMDAAMHQYLTSIWNPSKDACCAITEAHNDLWGLNPALYRIASALQRIRFHSETTNYTIYDMKADLKCRRVSIDNEVKRLLSIIIKVFTRNSKTSLSIWLRLMTSSLTMIRSTATTTIRYSKLVIGLSCRKSTVRLSLSNMRMAPPNESVEPKRKRKKNFDKPVLQDACHERPVNAQGSFNPLLPNPLPDLLFTLNHKSAIQGPAPRSWLMVRPLQATTAFSRSMYSMTSTKLSKKKKSKNEIIEHCSNLLRSLRPHRPILYVFNAPGVKNKTLVLQLLASSLPHIFYTMVPLVEELLVSCARSFFIELTFLFNSTNNNQAHFGGVRLTSDHNNKETPTLVTTLRKNEQGPSTPNGHLFVCSITQTLTHISSATISSVFFRNENECKRHPHRHAYNRKEKSPCKCIRNGWSTDALHRRMQRTHCHPPQLGTCSGHHDRTRHLVPLRKLRKFNEWTTKNRKPATTSTDRTYLTILTFVQIFNMIFSLYDSFCNIVRKKNHLFVELSMCNPH